MDRFRNDDRGVAPSTIREAGPIISRRCAIAWACALLGGRALHPLSARAAAPNLPGAIGDYYAFTDLPVLPPIAFQDAAGRARSLADFRGRIILLNFWATWCAPCVSEMAGLDRLQSEFATADFRVICLSEDRQNGRALEAFFLNHALRHLDVFLDAGGTALRRWSVPAIPTSFVVDRRGHVRGMVPGPAMWSSDEARELIEYYVAESRAPG